MGEERVRMVLSEMLGAQVNWRLKGRFRTVSTDGGGWYASTRPARGEAGIGSWKAIVREEGVRVALCRMLGAAGAGASIEVEPRGIGRGKDRGTGDLREHVAETLKLSLEQARRRSSEIIGRAIGCTQTLCSCPQTNCLCAWPNSTWCCGRMHCRRRVPCTRF